MAAKGRAQGINGHYDNALAMPGATAAQSMASTAPAAGTALPAAVPECGKDGAALAVPGRADEVKPTCMRSKMSKGGHVWALHSQAVQHCLYCPEALALAGSVGAGSAWRRPRHDDWINPKIPGYRGCQSSTFVHPYQSTRCIRHRCYRLLRTTRPLLACASRGPPEMQFAAASGSH